MKIYVTGISGSGKTSIARLLNEHGVSAVDIDEISHWENKGTKERTGWDHDKSDEWYATHEWICDIQKLKEVLLSSEHIVVVGHAANQEEYFPLFDKSYVLLCSPETIVARLNARTDNDFGKHPADQKRILGWQKSFESEMIEKGAEPLDAERPLEEVIADIRSNFS
ncbi:MAG: hypothetical protein AMXMBFR44_4560 [Candidatus Campbellbacteria bacterium]